MDCLIPVGTGSDYGVRTDGSAALWSGEAGGDRA